MDLTIAKFPRDQHFLLKIVIFRAKETMLCIAIALFLGSTFSITNAQCGNCSTINSLIDSPTYSNNSVNANSTILVSSIYNSFWWNKTVADVNLPNYGTFNYYYNLTWGNTQWGLFRGSYLKNKTTSISNSNLTLAAQNQMIYTVINTFLKSYINHTWFNCIQLGSWGYMAQYLKCKQGII